MQEALKDKRFKAPDTHEEDKDTIKTVIRRKYIQIDSNGLTHKEYSKLRDEYREIAKRNRKKVTFIDGGNWCVLCVPEVSKQFLEE
jgi:hypothetical protein